jgi:hypothetical protein
MMVCWRNRHRQMIRKRQGQCQPKFRKGPTLRNIHIEIYCMDQT